MSIIRFLRQELSLIGVFILAGVLFALCGGLGMLTNLLS